MTTAQTQNIRDLRQWVCWRSEERDGKTTKIPYSPLTGRKASSTNPETWGGYLEAVSACRKRGHDGIGFVFTKDDPFCGVDLDRCLDPDTGELEPWAREIIEELDSYAEVSPSGNGVHVLVRAALPDGRNRKRQIEIYDHGRYFTVSGDHLEGTPRTIEERQERLLDLRHRVLGEQPSANGHAPLRAAADTLLSDQEIIAKATSADNGEKFRRLWAGDTSGYEHDDNEGHSEADLALCSMLAFWTGPDPDRIDRLFRQSGLYRGKWERADYRERTIARALDGKTEFYEPGRTAPLKDNTASGDSREEKLGGLPDAASFPVGALPEGCQRFVREAAASIGCAPDLMAVPLLGLLSAAIGNSRQVRLKRSWKECAALFAVVVAEPGDKKTPAQKAALASMWR